MNIAPPTQYHRGQPQYYEQQELQRQQAAAAQQQQPQYQPQSVPEKQPNPYIEYQNVDGVPVGGQQVQQAVPVTQGQPVVAVVGGTDCRGCGTIFQPGPPNSEFRCQNCNKRAGKDMLCVNLTCGASSLCSIM